MEADLNHRINQNTLGNTIFKVFLWASVANIQKPVKILHGV